jgi:hypothetical protein
VTGNFYAGPTSTSSLSIYAKSFQGAHTATNSPQFGFTQAPKFEPLIKSGGSGINDSTSSKTTHIGQSALHFLGVPSYRKATACTEVCVEDDDEGDDIIKSINNLLD